jgi:hypothetical protein
MTRIRAAAVGLVLLAPVLAPAALAPTHACAVENGPHAALVVDTGSAVDAFCVALDAPSVSGVHLIELAASQRGVTYAFGFGGQAVCRLAGTGPGGGDCFADYPAFWGYWRGDGRGGWAWSGSGPADSDVGDGDIEGWVWGTGDTAATHDRPPPTTAAEVCAPTVTSPSPAPTASPVVAPPSRHATTPTLSTTATRSPSATATPARSATGIPERRTPSRTRTAGVAVRAAAADPPTGGGPQAGLFAALGIGLLLGAGGWLRLRSSRKASA